ncbi:MAG: DUF4838 domain-containing protein [Candidatus Nealsonbacteria bacterium]
MNKKILLISVLILSALISSAFLFLNKQQYVQAAFPDWGSINVIYYDPSQDDPANKFLEQAANEIKNSLGQAPLNKVLTITNTSPPAPAIYLNVDANLSDFSTRGDEAFKLYSDVSGIYVTGKTAIAARHGAYAFLEKLGFRWFFKSPAWNVVPDTLITLDLNEVQEPFYFFRQIGQSPQVSTGTGSTKDWIARNRLLGAKYYFNGESYSGILSKAGFSHTTATYAAHPDWFLPTGVFQSWPWQLQPDNAEVVAMAKAYARSLLSSAYNPWSTTLPLGAVSIIPNDGGKPGWNPPYSSLQQITDLAYTLANEVAKDIKNDFPGRYITMYSYSSHSCIPSMSSLEPNLIAIITTDYMDCGVSIDSQLTGLRAKGATLGIYDYYDVWEWWKDKPILKLDSVQRLAFYAQKGVNYFYAEAGDNWGAKGLTYYTASRMLWDPSQNFNAILTDFYDKAFGSAKVPMKSYYERTGSTLEVVGQNFNDLVQAESLAVSNPQILERIRQLEYYQRFLWFYHARGLANLSLDELKSFYTFVTKIRDLYLITYDCYGGCVGPTIKTELKNRGLTDAQITALQNFTPPTAAEAAAWLDEAKIAFGQIVPPIPDIDPLNLKLVPLGDTTKLKLTQLLGTGQSILIPSEGNENITVSVKGTMNGYMGGDFKWYNPYKLLIDSQTISQTTAWVSLNFSADVPGNYKLTTPMWPISSYYVDVPDHPASIIASEGTPAIAWIWSKINETYFYVPADTNAFIFGISKPLGTNITGSLIDPNGNTAQSLSVVEKTEWQLDNPAAGVWKIIINPTAGITTISFWLRGIPPLIWHDPQYLLVQAGTTPPSPPPSSFTLSSVNQLYFFRDGANLLQLLGSSFDLSTNFSIQFLQNSSVVSSFTAQPTNTTNLELSLTSTQINTLPIGLYDLKVVRTTDNISQIYSQKILITALGDISGTTAGQRDGKIDTYDISRMFSKWGSVIAADLQDCDINVGPADISQGKIDLYDANLMMRNWQP